MENKPLTIKQRTRIEKHLNAWQDDEIHQLELSILPQNRDDLVYEYKDELKNTVNLLDALIDISYMDDKKVFDLINQAFASQLAYKAKAGLLMRGEVETEINEFASITNLLRAAFLNKKSIQKMHCHYQGRQFDLDKLIKEDQEADRAASDIEPRNLANETLSQ